MYIIGLLGGLRLYQIRHHDVVINGHLAYASFAVVIFTSVIGVVSVAISSFVKSLVHGRELCCHCNIKLLQETGALCYSI